MAMLKKKATKKSTKSVEKETPIAEKETPVEEEQTTFNTDDVDVLVVGGDVENVEVCSED